MGSFGPALAACLLGATVAACSAADAERPAASTRASTRAMASPVRVVGIGDGFMSAPSSRGHSFMDEFAARVERSTGRPVELAMWTDWTNDPATSGTVRQALEGGGDVAKAVAAADVLVLSVGGNDVDPYGTYPKGTCSRQQPPDACLAAYNPDLVANYDAILRSVRTLSDGRSLAVRVTSADNPFTGLPSAPGPTFGRDFYAQVAEAETTAMFEVARKYGATTVDYLHVFCGPDGLADPGKYLAADHLHPGDLGIETIADLLAAAGTTP